MKNDTGPASGREDDEKVDSSPSQPPQSPQSTLSVSVRISEAKTLPEFNMIPAMREASSLLQLAERGMDLGTCCSPRVLVRSAVVLLAASWEAYVEDAVTQAVEFLCANAPSPACLPTKLKQVVAKALRENKNELAVWELAGSGWQEMLQRHTAELLDRYVCRFNTPKSERTRELFRDVLGLPDVTTLWGGLSGTTASEACGQLDKFLTMRGAIAHGASDAPEVSLEDAKQLHRLIIELVVQTSSAVKKHLKGITGRDIAERYAGQKVTFLRDPETGKEVPLVLDSREVRYGPPSSAGQGDG